MKNQSKHFYNNFSFFYPFIVVFLKPQKDKLLQEINNLPEGKLLEIGIGNGSHLVTYKKHKITGIDNSKKMLALAKRKQNQNIELMEMDGENLKFPSNSFDYVVLSHVIAVSKNPEKLLEEAFRVLKPKGKMLILNQFTPENSLAILDKLFNPIAKLFHFKSYFKLNSLKTLEQFELQKEINFGSFSYFKLLIYLKA